MHNANVLCYKTTSLIKVYFYKACLNNGKKCFVLQNSSLIKVLPKLAWIAGERWYFKPASSEAQGGELGVILRWTFELLAGFLRLSPLDLFPATSAIPATAPDASRLTFFVRSLPFHYWMKSVVSPWLNWLFCRVNLASDKCEVWKRKGNADIGYNVLETSH